jgi:hypothetical protein
MADMPSPIASSAAQSAYQSREVAQERDARRSQQTQAATQQVRSIDEAGRTVDTADADDRVFTDAEGQGSQGRSTDNPVPSAPEENQREESEGITRDADGQIHVDLQA